MEEITDTERMQFLEEHWLSYIYDSRVYEYIIAHRFLHRGTRNTIDHLIKMMRQTEPKPISTETK
jgi:hypothetical protein